MRALTAFLEAAAATRRAHLLAPLVAEARVKLSAGFARQGKLLAGHLTTIAQPVHEADTPAEPGWLDAWTVAAILAAWDALTIETASTLHDAIDVLARASLLAGAQEASADLGVGTSWTLENPRAVNYLTKYAAARVTQIDQTTRDQLATLLTDSLAHGESYSTVAGKIADTFAGFSRERAQLVAVTESGNAYSEGVMITGRDLSDAGLVVEKSWLTAQDEKVDPDSCGPNEDQGWIPVDELFQSGDDRPLAHPSCRCSILLRTVTPDDSAA